jgi:hypothetical protein
MKASDTAKRFRELLGAEPFRPFRITTKAGERARVHDPVQAAISPLLCEVIFYDERRRFRQVQVDEIASLDPVPLRRKGKGRK